MASRPCLKNDCLDCENYKRKIRENEQTVSARDVLIDMLQTELKKKENLFRNAIDEHEKLRFVHCSIVQDYTNLKEIYKKLTEDNKKLCEEKSALLAKLRDYDGSQVSSNELDNQSIQKKDSNFKTMADGISNIQNIMQCQNKSLRSMLTQLLEEMKRSRLEKSPEREKAPSKYSNCHCETENKAEEEEAYISTIECLNKQIENLNSFVEKLKRENKKIKENLYEKQASLANCLTVLENNNSDIDNLSEHVEGLCRERDKYREEVTVLETTLVTKETEICKLKLENKLINELNTENSKLTCENCCLKSKIETCLLENNETKKQIKSCMEDKIDTERKITQIINQYEQLQQEFDDYKSDVLQTIDQLQNPTVIHKTKETQCNKDCPDICNVQESATQCLEDCPSSCNKIAQIDELDIMMCPGSCNKPPDREMVDLEELQTLEKECRCIIQSLQEENDELKEGLSILSDNHKTKEEEFSECKCDLEIRIKELEVENSELLNEMKDLEVENKDIKDTINNLKKQEGDCKCAFENNIKELEIENKNLKDTINNLKQFEGDCRCALENRIKQLEEDNKKLRETLDKISKDDKEEFNACKCILENKIHVLEQENQNLKDTLILTTNEYTSKLNSKADEIHGLENKIKLLESEILDLKSAVEGKKEDLVTCRCVLEQKIAILESENKKLQDTCAENKTIIKALKDEAIILQNTLQHYEQQNQSRIDEQEYFDCKCALEQKIKQLQDENRDLQQTLAIVNSENRSNLNKINELSRAIKKLTEEHESICRPSCGVDEVGQANLTEEVIIELNIKIESLEKDLDTANLELTEYEEENRSYAQRLQGLLNEITCLQEAKLRADEDLNEYNQRMRHEFSNLKEEKDKTITDLKNKITALESKLIEFDSNLAKIQELQCKNSKLECLEKQKDEQLKECCNKLEDNRCKCEEYERLLNELESNKLALENKIADLEACIQEFSKETDHLKHVISDLEKGKDDINLEEIEKGKQELIKQLNSFQEQLERKQNIIKSLEECIDKSNNILENCEEEMKMVQKSNEKLRSELENKIKELEDCKSQSSCVILKNKIDQLLGENQKLKQQLNEGNQQHINKQITKLQSEYNKLLEESHAKDTELEIIKQQLSYKKPKSCDYKSCPKQKDIPVTKALKSCELRSCPKNKKSSTLQKESTPKSRKRDLHSIHTRSSSQKIRTPADFGPAFKARGSGTESDGETPRSRKKFSKSESICPALGKPCPSKNKGYQTEDSEWSGQTKKDICPPFGKPCPAKNRKSQSEEDTDLLDICPALGKPCPGRNKSDHKEDKWSNSANEDICPPFGKPCPAKNRKNQSEEDNLFDICPALGKPCPARNKSDQKEDKWSNSADEDICPPFGKPCPAKNRKSQSEEDTDLLDICPALGKPCPARNMNDQNEDKWSNSADEDICPPFGIPCPAKHRKSQSEDTDLLDICPALGKPCPAKNRSDEKEDKWSNSADEDICPPFGKPCPTKNNKDQSEEDTDWLDTCPGLGKSCPVRFKREAIFEEDICPVLKKSCPARTKSLDDSNSRPVCSPCPFINNHSSLETTKEETSRKKKSSDSDSSRSSPPCKCPSTRSSKSMRSTGSDPIQEIDRGSCNCMSIITKQYQSFNAEVKDLNPSNIYDILNIDSIPQNCDSCYENRNKPDPYLSEKVETMYWYEEFPQKCDDCEAKLEICQCDDDSTSSETSS